MSGSLTLSLHVPESYDNITSLNDYVRMARVTNNGDMLADALENRAKVFFDQGEHSRAYQDAQYLITLIPLEARGYLLRGHLLQKHYGFDCWELRETYKVALANVSPDDYSYPLLRLYYHRVDRVLRRSRKDVLDLPTDVCDIIFGYMPFENLAVATGVSKRWRHYVLGHPMLWRHIDVVYRRQLANRRLIVSNLDFLSHACPERVRDVQVKTFAMAGLTDWLLQQPWMQVTSLDLHVVLCTTHDLNRLLAHLGAQLTSLTLEGMRLSVGEMLRAIQRHCRRLRYFGTDGAMDDNTLIMSASGYGIVTTLPMQTLVFCRPVRLDTILPYCRHLRFLYMVDQEPTSSFWHRLWRTDRNDSVGELQRAIQRYQLPLQIFHYTSSCSNSLKHEMPALDDEPESISATSTRFSNNKAAAGDSDYGDKKVGLRTLSMVGNQAVQASTLYAFLHNCANTLQELDMRRCSAWRMVLAEYQAGRAFDLPWLRVLKVCDLPETDCGALDLFLGHCTRLQVLEITGELSFTDDRLLRMVARSELRRLKIGERVDGTLQGVRNLLEHAPRLTVADVLIISPFVQKHLADALVSRQDNRI
ncbi:hypothetical protein BCR43DRAFT_494211 [Syncephalastrum racemosum]|uniref:F-box domain-containing protein n=1 Tax=Syncephalastrum racemosum TaxID=13706 RepID=A0A1X2H7K9_SYNRA|nr:hypothetical protein BCR43DRAFT_494211 [Syncephalastrum racemosum]